MLLRRAGRLSSRAAAAHLAPAACSSTPLRSSTLSVGYFEASFDSHRPCFASQWTPTRSFANASSGSFETLGVDAKIVAALKEMRIDGPTGIQTKSIGAILAGHDVLCTAQTGTGKTLAYLVPVVEQFLRQEAEERKLQLQQRSESHPQLAEPAIGRPRALVVVPSRELARQISDVAKKLAHSAKFASTTITSGARKSIQVKQLSRRLDLVIGTPGRLAKSIKNGEFFLSRVNTVVFDEADTLFDAKMGFRKELDAVLGPVQQSATKRSDALQLVLVAATVKPPLDQVFKKKFGDLRVVSDANVHQTPGAVREEFVRVSPEAKQSALRDALALHHQKLGKTIVFCKNAASVRSTEHMLREHGVGRAVCLHGEMPAPRRHEAVDKFANSDETDILVCTDLAARGLDFPTVKHVVMFDFPNSAVDYVHRAGRTGRAGERGIVTSLVTKYDAALATTLKNAKRFKKSIKELRDSSVLSEEPVTSDIDKTARPHRGPQPTRRTRRRIEGFGTKKLHKHKLRTVRG